MKYLKYIFGILFTINCSIAGEYTNDFLRIGVGARPLAMGGAFVAMANDASTFYWNPAGMSRMNGKSVHFDHVPMFGGIAQYNAAHISLGFNKKFAVGLSWIRLGVDDIPRYETLEGTQFDRVTQANYRSTGEASGYFGNMEDALMVSFSRTFYFDVVIGGGFTDNKIPTELSFGLTGKYINHKLDDKKGTGQGLDAGVLLRMTGEQQVYKDAKSWMAFGLLARDLSRTKMVWNTASNHEDVVDLTLQSGFALSHHINVLATRFTLSFDQEFGFYEETHTGAEATFFNVLSLRGGYHENHFSIGAGISLMGFTIDYALVSNELANTHRISGAFHF